MSPPFTHFPNLLAELPPVPPDSIISRTVYSDERMKAILFGFAAGQELSEHTAARPAILHFLAGDARLTIDAETLEAQTGAWVHLAAQQPHSILARTPVTMLLLLL